VSGLTTENGFLLAMIERPDDDDLRLVFADWLEEQGDDRSKYFRKVAHPTTSEPPETLPWRSHWLWGVGYDSATWAKEQGGWKCDRWENQELTNSSGHKYVAPVNVVTEYGIRDEDVPLVVRAAVAYRHWPRTVRFLDVIGVGIFRQKYSRNPWSYCHVRKGPEKYDLSFCRKSKKDAECYARKEAEWYAVEYVGVIETLNGTDIRDYRWRFGRDGSAGGWIPR
jgi:uncharacterized protein (TIGR02996 family)